MATAEKPKTKKRKPRQRPTPEHVADRTAERAWLQRTVIEIESILWGRWPYWLEAQEREGLDERPIPQVPFDLDDCRPLWLDKIAGLPDAHEIIHELGSRHEARHNLVSTFERALGTGCHLHQLIDWLLWALGSPRVKERPKLPESAAVTLYHGLELQRLIAHPADWMAVLGCEFLPKGSGAAWFPTPTHVASLMANMLFQADGRDHRTLSVCDPCVGTGVMLLAASNYSVNLYGQDVSHLMCAMTEINAWFYMPWLVYPGRWLDRDGIKQPTIAPGRDENVTPGLDPAARRQLDLF